MVSTAHGACARGPAGHRAAQRLALCPGPRHRRPADRPMHRTIRPAHRDRRARWRADGRRVGAWRTPVWRGGWAMAGDGMGGIMPWMVAFWRRRRVQNWGEVSLCDTKMHGKRYWQQKRAASGTGACMMALCSTNAGPRCLDHPCLNLFFLFNATPVHGNTRCGFRLVLRFRCVPSAWLGCQGNTWSRRSW